MTQRNERPASRFDRNAGRLPAPGQEIDHTPEVILLTRAGCHLCVDAQAVLEEVRQATGVPWQSVDIDADPTLQATFGEQIPVLLIDGQVQARWRLDAGEITAALRRL